MKPSNGKEEKLRLEYVPVSQVAFWDQNPKKHDIDGIIQSIADNGYADPSKHDPSLNGGAGGLVFGNGRAKCIQLMKERGMKPPRGIVIGDDGEWHLPVLFGIDAESEFAAKRFAIDHNNLVASGSGFDVFDMAKMWENESYINVLKDLREISQQPITVSANDIDLLFSILQGSKREQNEYVDPEELIDQAEELNKKWKVKLGQIWKLGKHLIICGDSTDRKTIKALLNNDKVHCTVTDPPYGVGIAYKDFVDTHENVRALVNKIMPIIFDYLPAAITPGNFAMWFYPEPTWTGAWIHPAAMGRCPWGFSGNNAILYYGDDPYLKAGKGSRMDSLVLAVDREKENTFPVTKPLKVWSWLIERISTEVNQIVFDPFNGSGTSIIASEQLGRICRAIELTPAYVAVTLERWEKFTGEMPVKIPKS